MKSLIWIFLKSFKDILKRQIISVILLPFVGSFILWGFVTWARWDWIVSIGFKLYGMGIMQNLVEFLSPYFIMTPNPLVAVTAGAFIFAVILPAVLITAILITSIFLVPLIVSEIRHSDFPSVVKKSNSLFAGAGVALSYSAKYFISWIGLMPFWFFIPAGTIIIPYLLLSWFNSRLFTWEVMIELADPLDIKSFIEENSKSLFALSLLTSLIYYIPILNLIAPVISSAAFARFCLSKINSQTQKIL